MDMDNVSKVGFCRNHIPCEEEYMDNDIIFLNGIKDLPMADGVLRVDRFVSVICYTGKLQVDINMTTHSICAGQVLICIQNDIIGNAMQSPDFDGAVLSLSPEIIINQFGESNIWDYFFHLADHPIINAHAENLEMLRIYYEAFSRKMRMGQTVFGKKIIFSIVKAVFYELMENILPLHPPSCVKGPRRGKILLKQFMELLSGSVVKSRTVLWYAERLCVTPKHLSTVCKQVSGKTAFEWINAYVAIDIRNLLKNTDKSIKEIADMLRFPNTSFFGSYCRKHFGMSPMEYRKFLRTSTSENENTRQYERNYNK